MTIQAVSMQSLPQDLPRLWFLLPLTVGCGSFMTGLDQNVVVTALPAIAANFGEVPSRLGLLVTAYVASLIISLPLGGWVSERFGIRNAYCAAVLVFAAASALCGLSNGLWAMVASRALQGFGGALMGTLGQIVILQSFPRERTLRINMVVSLAGQSGPLVGPLLGGALTTYISWRWIFFINVPLCIVAAAIAAWRFPAGRSAAKAPFDLVGFVLLGAGMVLLVLGMDRLAALEPPRWLFAAELCAALVLLAVAVVYFLRVANPLLDLRLLKIRTFRISFVTGGGWDTMGMTSVMFLLPLLFQEGFGMSAVQAGSLTFFAAIGSILTRLGMPRLLKQFGFRTVLVSNTPLAAAVVAGFALFQGGMPSWLAAAYIFVFGITRSIQWASTGNLSYADVAPEQLTRFSAMYFILWQIASALGVGAASALLSLLSGQAGHASVGDFRIVFAVEGLITVAGLAAYVKLRPDDGARVAGRIAAPPE